MGVWAIVPVKPLRRGKSRLAPALTVNERTMLNRRLLIHTLEVLGQVEAIEQVLVVSRDTGALALARQYGARTLQERGDSQLNLALRHATSFLQAYRVGAVMVLPADLPLLEPADIQALVAALEAPPAVVLAPDRHHEGTNALLMTPPGVIRYRYGPGSFARHREEAEAAGVRLRIVERPGLAWDLDWPEDLQGVTLLAPGFPWAAPSARASLGEGDPADVGEKKHASSGR